MRSGPYRNSRLLTESEFRRCVLEARIYAIVWVAMLASLVTSWMAEIPMLIKAALLILLALFTPSIGDFFKSYSAYKQEWEVQNKKEETNPGQP